MKGEKMTQEFKPEELTRGEVTVWLMHYASAEDIRAVAQISTELTEKGGKSVAWTEEELTVGGDRK